MIHHLRGTSAALAENVFIRGGKRHGNYGRGVGVSTLVTAESTSRSPHRQGRMALSVLSRKYNAPSRLFAHRLFALCPVFVRCRLKLVSRNSRSCHRPRQSSTKSTWPDKIRRFTRRFSNKGARIIAVLFIYCRAMFRLRTQEGTRALDDAIRFLNRAKPQPPLALSPGLCLAAADHCREQAGGAVGHYGNHGSDPGNRISRYGVVSQGWAENIAYGRHTAREIVLALIVDDGVRGRGHRKNIFNPTYNVAGAACGSHARFGSVCSIDFASGYVENRFVRAGSDAQNSF